jgi:hypothetical protein
METLTNILAALRSDFNPSTAEVARFELLPPVPPREIAEVEAQLGWSLPADYAWFLLHQGRLVAYDDEGCECFRMLTPRESLAIIQNEKDSFVETVFGDEPDAIAQAHRELDIRLALYPFQYVSQDVSDFYCFWMRGQAPVLNIFHDDFDLSDWLGQPAPRFQADAFPRDFTEHLDWMARQIVEGEYEPATSKQR